MSIQRRATIQKMLRAWTAEELMRHIAHEIEQEAAHLEMMGAPVKAGRMREEVSILRGTAQSLAAIWSRQ